MIQYFGCYGKVFRLYGTVFRLLWYSISVAMVQYFGFYATVLRLLWYSISRKISIRSTQRLGAFCFYT